MPRRQCLLLPRLSQAGLGLGVGRLQAQHGLQLLDRHRPLFPSQRRLRLPVQRSKAEPPLLLVPPPRQFALGRGHQRLHVLIIAPPRLHPPEVLQRLGPTTSGIVLLAGGIPRRQFLLLPRLSQAGLRLGVGRLHPQHGLQLPGRHRPLFPSQRRLRLPVQRSNAEPPLLLVPPPRQFALGRGHQRLHVLIIAPPRLHPPEVLQRLGPTTSGIVLLAGGIPRRQFLLLPRRAA